MERHPIIALTMRARSDDYPYHAPSASYVIDQDSYYEVQANDMPELSDRVAVLSIGSNRSPQQLLRKFGDDSFLPVTKAVLKDCDVVHSACFSYYGAVPCTAFPCAGTDIHLNAVWLTPPQLQIMHDTEAVGIAYDFCRWHDGYVQLDGQHPDDIYGYATRLGFLSDAQDKPYGLAALPAQNRQFNALSQLQARQILRDKLPLAMRQADEPAFMMRLVSDKDFRLSVNAYLAGVAHEMPKGPWRILPATPMDADSFL